MRSEDGTLGEDAQRPITSFEGGNTDIFGGIRICVPLCAKPQGDDRLRVGGGSTEKFRFS